MFHLLKCFAFLLVIATEAILWLMAFTNQMLFHIIESRTLKEAWSRIKCCGFEDLKLYGEDADLQEEIARLHEIIEQYEMAHTDDQVMINAMDQEINKLKAGEKRC